MTSRWRGSSWSGRHPQLVEAEVPRSCSSPQYAALNIHDSRLVFPAALLAAARLPMPTLDRSPHMQQQECGWPHSWRHASSCSRFYYSLRRCLFTRRCILYNTERAHPHSSSTGGLGCVGKSCLSWRLQVWQEAAAALPGCCARGVCMCM
jgi:hypothetical protein